MKNNFTEPKLKQYPASSDKDWYVWFRFNGSHPIRIRKGLNQIEDLDERRIEGLGLAKAIHIQLKRGWIPPSCINLGYKNAPIAEVADISLSMKLKSISDHKNYKSAIKFFKEGLKDLKFNRVKSHKFERAHAKIVLEHLRDKREWKNKNYNKYLGLLRTIMDEGLDLGYFKSNPFHEIRNLKVIKQNYSIFEPPTDEEMVTICNELKEKNYGFYVFFMIIYYCGIRPEELRLLKIADIDFENRYIWVLSENAKNGKKDKVPMVGRAYELLKMFKGMDDDLFVFGTWLPNGGRHSSKNWFSPNKYSLKKDTPNKQWKKLIKDGLGINRSLYSGKHKGAVDKHEAGMDIKTISNIFRHSKTQMTERYMRNLADKRKEDAKKIQLKVF